MAPSMSNSGSTKIVVNCESHIQLIKSWSTMVDIISIIGAGQIMGLVVWSFNKLFDNLTLSSQCVCRIFLQNYAEFWHHCTSQIKDKSDILTLQEKLSLFSEPQLKLLKLQFCLSSESDLACTLYIPASRQFHIECFLVLSQLIDQK